MSIRGALDVLDDDELAYVMAHELTHGEKRHSVAGVKKQVGLVTAVDIYLSDNPSLGALLLGDIAANYVSNAVFTKDQEKQADDIGFDYLVDAGYNPGAAAASMQVLYNKYGNSAPSGIKAVIAPGNHPATSDRINKNVKRMYEYSNRHVNVKDGWIIVNEIKRSNRPPEADIQRKNGPIYQPVNWPGCSMNIRQEIWFFREIKSPAETLQCTPCPEQKMETA